MEDGVVHFPASLGRVTKDMDWEFLVSGLAGRVRGRRQASPPATPLPTDGPDVSGGQSEPPKYIGLTTPGRAFRRT